MKSNTPPKIALVLPCFNESVGLSEAVSILGSLLKKYIEAGTIDSASYLYFVDDGSTDSSWQELQNLSAQFPWIQGQKLSRNCGHQLALLAGLTAVTDQCDAAISMDVDLQQDPDALGEFIEKYKSGADLVLGIRKNRETDSYLKKTTARFFYKSMALMGVKLKENHADYRLMSHRALKALAQFQEPNPFLRALCLSLGFKVDTVFFDVSIRKHGESKYTFKKMIRLALYGITSFSVAPLRLVAFLGFSVFGISVIMSGYVFWQTLVVGDVVPGWASTILPIYFIGGVQLLCLGIVGEYVGQIFQVVKNRPRWITEDTLTK